MKASKPMRLERPINLATGRVMFCAIETHCRPHRMTHALPEIQEIVELPVEEVRRTHLGQRAGDRLDAPRLTALPIPEHLADLFALEVILRAAQCAGNDREALGFGVGRQIVFGDVRERPDHHLPAVVRAQLGGHRFQLPAVEQIEEESRQDVVTVMAERNLRRAELARYAVQHAATQPRAERAHCLPLRNDALDHRVGVLLDDAELYAAGAKVLGKDMPREPRLLLVQIDSDQLELYRRLFSQGQKNVQESMAVLAARQAYHYPVARLEHVEVRDSLAHLAAQPLGELAELVVGLARVAVDADRSGGHRERECT